MVNHALGLVEPPTRKLALGTASHTVLAANFRQKIESKQDLPAQQIEESFGVRMAAEKAHEMKHEGDHGPATLGHD